MVANQLIISRDGVSSNWNAKQIDMNKHDLKEKQLRERIKQLEIEIEDMQEFACIVCFERKKNMTLKPCNHLIVCQKCVSLLTHCPLCRTAVESSEVTFF